MSFRGFSLRDGECAALQEGRMGRVLEPKYDVDDLLGIVRTDIRNRNVYGRNNNNHLSPQRGGGGGGGQYQRIDILI